MGTGRVNASVMRTHPGQIVAEIIIRICYSENQLAVDVGERGTLSKRLVVGSIVCGEEGTAENKDQ